MGHNSDSIPSAPSGSFAADVLSRFAPQLERFEASLALPSTPASEDQQGLDAAAPSIDSAADNSSTKESRKDNVSKAVADIISAIPVTESASVPSQSTLVKLLNRLDRAFSTDDGSGTESLSSSGTNAQQTESLRLAALARVTYAAYAIVLDALLRDASRLSDEAWFWTEVEESTYRTVGHLVQTFPHRAAALVGATLEMAAENATQTVRGTLDLARPHKDGQQGSAAPDKTTLRNTLRTILATPNMVTGILFPYQFQSEGSITFALVQEHAREKQQARERAFGHARASQNSGGDSVSALSVKKRSGVKKLRSAALRLSPTHMARHEARCKRQGLMHERDRLAQKLGELALCQTKSANGEKQVSLDSVDLKAASAKLLQDLGQKLQMMASAMRHDDGTSSDEVEITMESASSSPEALIASLRTLLQETLPRNDQRTQLILSPSRFGQPSQLTQNWPSLVFYPFAALVVSRYVTNNWDGIAAKMQEAKETVRGFLIGWVWEPCVQLLETVRHGNDEGVIISRESLQSDLESLERMVATFTSEKYGISGPELDAVTSRVRQGDLTHVLKIYENEMRSPLKSAVSGSLVHSLLIQIQKAKVDLEVAMSGIDKLLKSQQLLFGAVGIAPALGILYVTKNWLMAKLRGAGGGRARRNAQSLKLRAWEALRRIDRLLSSPSSSNSTLPPLNHGLMLLDLSLLRSASYPLLLSVAKGNRHLAKRLQRQFLHDVRDLESSHGIEEGQASNQPGGDKGSAAAPGGGSGGYLQQPGLGYWSRRAAVERMWRSWGGVIQIDA